MGVTGVGWWLLKYPREFHNSQENFLKYLTVRELSHSPTSFEIVLGDVPSVPHVLHGKHRVLILFMNYFIFSMNYFIFSIKYFIEFMNFLIFESLEKSQKVLKSLGKSRKISTHGHSLKSLLSLVLKTDLFFGPRLA